MIMRSQGCTIQQALTPEAAAVVKQAVGLAKRRGHAQVTPLHVAHTMLSGSSSGLFRAACLQAHSHPLQCRALELCFNVALQRLPTSTVVPMLGPISSPTQQPAIANALVAAFKRAQAHQRRGVIENNQQQQQPILAVKIEVEQLIISILDDPSVSRVMREAGFSSPLVKSKVEQALSSMDLPTSQNQSLSNEKMGANPNQNDDVKGVIDSLTGKRNTVVVGESVETLEGIAKQVMERMEKGEVPQNLKEIKFIKVSLSSFGHLSKEKVEERVGELKSLIKGYNNKGVILYIDDLKWAIEFRSRNNNNNNNNDDDVLKDQQQSRWRSYYCPIEQVIVEIGKLGLEYLDMRVKVWILGIATFETYMRCRSGEPSLESIWDLHAITIPASSLSLSLIPHSDLHLEIPLRNKKIEFKGSGGCKSESTSSSVLPPWLQKYKEEKSKRDQSNDDDQDFLVAKDLTRWGSFCNSTTTQPSKSFERSLSFTSISPSSTLSFSPYDHHYLKLYPTLQSYEPKNFWANEVQTTTHDTNKDHPQQWLATIRISSNPSSSTPTPTSSSEIKEQMESQCVLAPRFNEYNTDNLKMICNALEQKAPSQKEIIFDIASTILHCRSGKTRRKGNSLIVNDNENRIKEDTWLFFEGGDIEAKEKIARELSMLIFGSEDKFVSIGISSFSSSRAESLEDSRNKRLRDEQSCSYVERFVEAMSSNPHRVFFVEDLEQVDYSSQMGFMKAIEGGKATKYSSGEEVSFCDAIIILSCERFSSKSRACSPSMKLIEDAPPSQEGGTKPSNKSDDASLEVSTSSSISLDLNISINCGEEDEVDQNVVREESRDEIGLLAVVDRCFVFKIVTGEL